jgi:ubiquinone/menaquinone biosynthesis C-methylase UbiE
MDVPKATMDERDAGQEEREYYSLSRRVYEVFASFYDAVVFPIRGLRRKVASLVELRPGSRLLDVATGTGAQAFAFAEKAREVVGIDLSEAMLRIARRKNRFPNITFQQADAAELPFEDGTRSDVAALLESEGIRVSDHRLSLGGLARIMVGRRREAASHTNAVSRGSRPSEEPCSAVETGEARS